MGIYIKGMAMPKNCEECRMADASHVFVDGFCHAAYKWLDDPWFDWPEYEEGDIDTSKPLNCPLIEIPEPHGRLIDADTLYEYITNKVGGVDCAVLLDNEISPTVIERSEE